MSWIEKMDWAWVIDRNRTMLLNIVATLFAMAGLDLEQGGLSGHNSGTVTLPRWVRRSIMLVLRPAESAMRRLVIIAARGVTVEAPPAPPQHPARSKPDMVLWQGRIMPYSKLEALLAAGINSPNDIPPPPPARTQAFQLFDPLPRSMSKRRRKPRFVPADLCTPLSIPGVTGLYRLPPLPEPAAGKTRVPPQRDDALNAHRLILRLQALKGALDDIPAQAKRLTFWRARRERDPNARPKRRTPLRPGRPPGRRKRRIHEVDRILNACDNFAWAILKEKIDTS